MRFIIVALALGFSITGALAGTHDKERAACERHTVRKVDRASLDSRYEKPFAKLCKALDEKERLEYEASSGNTAASDLGSLKAKLGQQ